MPGPDFDPTDSPATVHGHDPPSGAITGVFVEAVDYETGPVDAKAICVEDQPTPCRVYARPMICR